MLQRKSLIESISHDDINLFKHVTDLVTTFSEMRNTLPLHKRPKPTCHIFARAIALHIEELQVIDGYYLGIEIEDSKYLLTRTEHSWLLTPNKAIIEPYAVGFLSVTPVFLPQVSSSSHAYANYYLEDKEFAGVITDRMKQTRNKKKIEATALLCLS